MNRLNQNAKSLKLKKDKLLDFYLDEKIGENNYKSRSERLDKELQNLYDCISKIALTNDDFEKCLDYVCKALGNIKNIWLTSDLDTKQRLQQLIFPNGLIYENGGLLPPDFKMVPQANSNRCLHRESIAYRRYLCVFLVKDLTGLTLLIGIIYTN